MYTFSGILNASDPTCCYSRKGSPVQVRIIDTIIYSIYTFILFCLFAFFKYTTGMYLCGTLLTIYISNLYILHEMMDDLSQSNLDTSMSSTEVSDSEISEISEISEVPDIYSECDSDFDNEINEFVKEIAQEVVADYKDKNAKEAEEAADLREAELRADKADEREYNED
jgi:hypothetical protein